MNAPGPSDDELRDALGAGSGAGPVPPRPPFDDVRHRARRMDRSRRALAGSGLALVLIAAGVVGWSLTGDDPEETDVVTDGDADATTTTVPTTTTTPGSGATTTSTSIVASPDVVVPDPGARPDELVAVDEHGRLVVVEAESGEELRELDADGDPTEPVLPGEEMGPNVLDDVALTGDGIVYYTSVGEPVSGTVRRIGFDGTPVDGEERYWFQGNDVAVRPDGIEVAAVTPADVDVVPTSSGPYASDTRQLFGTWVTDDGGLLGAVDWSLDAGSIAVTSLQSDESHRPTHYAILVAPASGGTASNTAVLEAAAEGRTYTDPAFRRDGALVVAEQDWCPDQLAPGACGNAVARVLDPATGEVLASFEYGNESAVVSQAYDATGTWLLVAFEDGTLRWYGSGQTGTVPGRYRAADW